MKVRKAADRLVSDLPRLFHACSARPGKRPARGERLPPALSRLLGRLDPGEGVPVSVLAERLGVTPSTASLTVDRLEGRGLVERGPDPADGRRVLVRLTEAGAEAGRRAGLLDPDRARDLLRRLSPGRRRKALRGLRILAEAAALLPPDRGGPRDRAPPVPAPPPPPGGGKSA